MTTEILLWWYYVTGLSSSVCRQNGFLSHWWCNG